MREMKFREMNKYLGSMCYSDNCERGLEQFFGGVDGPIMQYTGLKDKNGKEIYENDIVKDIHGIYKVEFVDSGFMPFIYHGTEVDPEDCEIIGNIHENPELLKGA